MEDIKRNNGVTIAIFPFENLSGSTEMDVFCKSFYVDLVTELSRFRQFRIIAYGSLSANQYEYSIRGSFRCHEDVLKITAQLINTSSNNVAWADRYEGGRDSIFSIQEDLLRAIVSSLQVQLNYDLLIHTRKRSPVSLTAYENWLYGMEELKKGSLEADEKARVHFQHAIETDPGYSLAYSGMSLTYFNEWSCQLWERWDASQKGAFEWAKKAIGLDEQNYVAACVLGRIYLYEGEYDLAGHYLRRALHLNPNDTDNLVQIASCFVFLGYLAEAEELYQSVLQLNPLYADNYYHVGALIAFEQGHFEKSITLGLNAKRPWVDSPAILAAAYYESGDTDNMYCWWQTFLQGFQKKILKGKINDDFAQAIQWIATVNPYKTNTRMMPFWQFISGKKAAVVPMHFSKAVLAGPQNFFRKEADIWQISFEGKTIRMTEVKGFYDLVKLLGNPEKQFHCTALMGGSVSMGAPLVFDEKAKRSYRKKILELQEEIRWCEDNNDLQRTASLHREYDDIVDHLRVSLGIGGRVRKTHDPNDKIRSAVTWRIRKAIQKVEKHHPALGKHLSVSIKTGLFCSYSPENPVQWILDEESVLLSLTS